MAGKGVSVRVCTIVIMRIMDFPNCGKKKYY